MSGRIINYGEALGDETQQPFPFLKLPAEIRNMIYRLLLLTENVTTKKSATIEPSIIQGEIFDGVTTVPQGEAAIGTIRCKFWRTYTIEYQIAILLTNRQIHLEAWGIFQLENFWTLVRVNKAGFTNEMKDCNFPVVTVAADRPWWQAKFPVMKLTVTFPSLEDQKQSDVFLVPMDHIKKLMRVLWTVKGASEMLVIIDIQPPRTYQSPSEKQLLRPFFYLRSIKQLVILGASKREYVDQLTRAVTVTDGMKQVFIDLVTGVKCLRRYITAEQWGFAAALEKNHLMLIMDSRTVYDIRYTGQRAAMEINIATATSSAEIALHEKNYVWAICFAERSLYLISKISLFFNNVSPFFLVPPYHQLLSPAGIITSEKEVKCKLLLIRARAYMGTRQPYSAFRDIKKASKIMPNSVAVASISETWQSMFGPSPRPLPIR